MSSKPMRTFLWWMAVFFLLGLLITFWIIILDNQNHIKQ